MRSHAHFKSVTQAKPFSGFKIVSMHDQNFFRGFGVITLSQSDLFQQIKYDLTIVNVPSTLALSVY